MPLGIDYPYWVDDYNFRAEVAQIGLGALKPEQSIYPIAQVDHYGRTPVRFWV